MNDKNLLIKRIIMSFLGVIILSISVAIFRTAKLGVDPFQTLMEGLDALIPINFGTLYVITNIILLLFSLIFDKHYIGLATFINLLLLGYIAEYVHRFILLFIVNPSIVIRLIIFIIGIIVMCFGSSLYITADLGVSTYDAIALIISNTWKKGKFKYIRICTDFICVLLGLIILLIAKKDIAYILGVIGLGTIITAFFTGPLIEYFNNKFSKPLLEKSL